ncbi:MAG: hypothetical protein GY713_20665 [Actinomycetia bacterium]|nr:hypothetical protein [Actinomycetes bacterium]
MTDWTPHRSNSGAYAVLGEHLDDQDCSGLDRAVVMYLGWHRFDTTVFFAGEGWEDETVPPLDRTTSEFIDDPVGDLDLAALKMAQHIQPGEMTDFLLTGPRASDPVVLGVFGHHLGPDRVFSYPGPGAVIETEPTESEEAAGPTGRFGNRLEPYNPVFSDQSQSGRRRRRWWPSRYPV